MDTRNVAGVPCLGAIHRINISVLEPWIFCRTNMLLSLHGVRSKSYLCFAIVGSIITIFGNQQYNYKFLHAARL